MQIKIEKVVRERARNFARSQGKQLNELVLELFAKAGDKELKQAAEQALKEMPKKGRPWHKS